jgi:anaerobic ribonucleoside-triphosphate reductase activating protein
MREAKRFLGVDGMNSGNRRQALRIAAYEPRSMVNGPGVRAVLWVQGCGKRCPGCFNPDFQPVEGGRWEPVAEVLRWVASATEIEGVTFSGGEPFDQAGALAELARGVQKLGLGVVVFSGYTRAELEDGGRKTEIGCQGAEDRDGWQELLKASDLIVAGPYERERPSKHALLASTNQELMFMTERYRQALGGLRRRMEFHIAGDAVRVTGFPKFAGGGRKCSKR